MSICLSCLYHRECHANRSSRPLPSILGLRSRAWLPVRFTLGFGIRPKTPKPTSYCRRNCGVVWPMQNWQALTGMELPVVHDCPFGLCRHIGGRTVNGGATCPSGVVDSWTHSVSGSGPPTRRLSRTRQPLPAGRGRGKRLRPQPMNI